MDQVVITMRAGPEEYKDGRGIIEWYTDTDYLGDFLDVFAADGKGTMTYDRKTGLYEIRFTKNQHWPEDLTVQRGEVIAYLETPDDDGNYLLNGNFVSSTIQTINGHMVAEPGWSKKND